MRNISFHKIGVTANLSAHGGDSGVRTADVRLAVEPKAAATNSDTMAATPNVAITPACLTKGTVMRGVTNCPRKTEMTRPPMARPRRAAEVIEATQTPRFGGSAPIASPPISSPATTAQYGVREGDD